MVAGWLSGLPTHAAIGSIPGARAVHVPRSRFAPVKTTDDLLVIRSDAYELTSDGTQQRYRSCQRAGLRSGRRDTAVTAESTW